LVAQVRDQPADPADDLGHGRHIRLGHTALKPQRRSRVHSACHAAYGLARAPRASAIAAA
ncbi:hypothetical protein WLW66_21845, partial [Bordetella bronchiseptica]